MSGDWLTESNTDCSLGDGNEGTIAITYAYTPGGNDDTHVVYYH